MNDTKRKESLECKISDMIETKIALERDLDNCRADYTRILAKEEGKSELKSKVSKLHREYMSHIFKANKLQKQIEQFEHHSEKGSMTADERELYEGLLREDLQLFGVWTAEKLAKALKLPEKTARKHLEALYQNEFMAKSDKEPGKYKIVPWQSTLRIAFYLVDSSYLKGWTMAKQEVLK